MTDAFERAARRTQVEHRSRRRQRSTRLQQKALRIHASIFVAVQALLVVVWAVQWQLGGTDHPWFLYALFGWGVGLAAHFAVTRERF
jgi:hypothetical protein